MNAIRRTAKTNPPAIGTDRLPFEAQMIEVANTGPGISGEIPGRTALFLANVGDRAGNAQKRDERDYCQHEKCDHWRMLTTYQLCTAQTNPLRPVFY